MAKKIRVILLEDVDGYGRGGDIVTVSEGYARNNLFPAGLAALATDQLEDQHQQQRRKQEKESNQKLAELQELAASYDNTELTIIAKVNDEHELYGSITSKDIAARLSEEGKIKVKAKDVILPEGPIKIIGTYPATVTLSPEVDFSLNVTVLAEETDNDA